MIKGNHDKVWMKKADLDKHFELKSMPNALNAGVDINHFRPVTFAELVKNNQEFKDSII